MGEAAKLIFQLLPQAISAAMDDYGIEGARRVAVRALVKSWHVLNYEGLGAVATRACQGVLAMACQGRLVDACPVGSRPCSCEWYWRTEE